MIHTPERSGFFYGQQVARLLDNTDEASISPGIAADQAGIGFRKSETAAAQLDGTVQSGKIFNERPSL
jgi:hypothetical protein